MKFNRPTLVTITAPTASGKTYLLNALTHNGIFSRIVSTTTRLPRAGETPGIDYDYISKEQSLAMEERGEFFELIEFKGVRYGVTNEQMERAIGDKAHGSPVVILEPQGLQIYREKCIARGWEMFQIYVHQKESDRIERVRRRTAADISEAVVAAEVGQADAIINYHNEILDARLKSIQGDERRWMNMFSWDAIVPGDNVGKAIEMIELGIRWRNMRNAEPVPFDGVVV